MPSSVDFTRVGQKLPFTSPDHRVSLTRRGNETFSFNQLGTIEYLLFWQRTCEDGTFFPVGWGNSRKLTFAKNYLSQVFNPKKEKTGWEPPTR